MCDATSKLHPKAITTSFRKPANIAKFVHGAGTAEMQLSSAEIRQIRGFCRAIRQFELFAVR